MRYVIDTNVLLDDLSVIDNYEQIILPSAVLEELDGLKKNPDTKYRSQQAIKKIEANYRVDIDQKMNKNEKFMKAARLGNLEEVQRLVRKDRINVNSVKAEVRFCILVVPCIIYLHESVQFGWTPLMKAVKHGHLETVRFLVEEGKADVHTKNNVSANI